ncbi:hypothetical protein Tco_1359557 [Tanacetum coccineum]
MSTLVNTSSTEISVLKQKHDELLKKSLLTRSQFEGQLKEKNKVVSDLKVKEGRDIDKMIEMEKQIKFLNEILYKRNQSIQTIHMLAPKCATYHGRSTFANPKYCKQAQSNKPCLYQIPYDTSDPANRFAPDGEEIVTLSEESRSKLDKDKVKPYNYTYQNSLYENFKPPSKAYLDQLERAKEVRKTMWRKKRIFTSTSVRRPQLNELSSERQGRQTLVHGSTLLSVNCSKSKIEVHFKTKSSSLVQRRLNLVHMGLVWSNAEIASINVDRWKLLEFSLPTRAHMSFPFLSDGIIQKKSTYSGKDLYGLLASSKSLVSGFELTAFQTLIMPDADTRKRTLAGYGSLLIIASSWMIKENRTALQCLQQRQSTWHYLQVVLKTEYQLADMFTKALPEDRFKYLVRRIGMRCLTPAELEVVRLGINPMIQPEPEDLPKDNPKLEIAVLSAPNAPSKTPSTKDTSSSSIDYIPKSPTSSTSPSPNGYLNPSTYPPPRVSPSPPTQDNASIDITLTLSPNTPLDVQFDTPSPLPPIIAHLIPWNFL